MYHRFKNVILIIDVIDVIFIIDVIDVILPNSRSNQKKIRSNQNPGEAL